LGTRIHVSGLSYFCTDATLRQAFTPFGTVVVAQVVRDECGHALGTGVVHMARSEDVERVFNEHQRFELPGSRVDLWEPAEPEEKSRTSLKPLTVLRRRLLVETPGPSSRHPKH